MAILGFARIDKKYNNTLKYSLNSMKITLLVKSMRLIKEKVQKLKSSKKTKVEKMKSGIRSKGFMNLFRTIRGKVIFMGAFPYVQLLLSELRLSIQLVR